MPLDSLTAAAKERLTNTLGDIRDLAMSLAGAALRASIAVHRGTDDDAEALAKVVAMCEQNYKMAQTLSRELNR